MRDSLGEVAEFGAFGLRLTMPPGAGPRAQPRPLAPGTVRPADRVTTVGAATNGWKSARPVGMFRQLCARGELQPDQADVFARWWDHTLRLMLHSAPVHDRFNASTYEPCERNCFTFVLAFLKSLRIDGLEPWLDCKTTFTQRFLMDELRELRGSGRRFA